MAKGEIEKMKLEQIYSLPEFNFKFNKLKKEWENENADDSYEWNRQENVGGGI
jgi:hypothetical protein